MWRSIRIKLVAIHVLLILFALQLIGAYFVRAMNQSLLNSETAALSRQAQLIATLSIPEVLQSESNQGDSTSNSSAQPTKTLLQSFPELLNGVVYVLNRDGVVKDTSAGVALIGQKRMDSMATQTLVSHQKTVAVHYDPVSDDHLLTVVVPILSGHKFVGLVESVMSVQNTYATMRQVTEIFYTGSGLVLCLTAVLGIILSRTIARPVLDVTKQARKLADGDFTERVHVHSDDEFGQLAQAINNLTDKLEDALASNQHEQERLQTVIKYIGDGVIAFDKDFTHLFSNDAALRLLPKAHSGESDPAHTLNLRKVTTDGKGQWNFIKEIGNALLEVHVTQIRKNQQVEGYVALLRDVTAQEKLQSARRDFVANVSHELKTPLTSVKSYLEALQAYQDTDEETKSRFLAVMDNEVNRMVRLTNDLLQLSGLEMKSEQFRAGLIEVHRWLVASEERFSMTAEKNGVDFALRVSEVQGRYIRGDRDMLDRLLDNLISNAFKYTPRGGQVSLISDVQEDSIQVAVKDTGIGIPEEDLPHVFERFYTVDKARTHKLGGTGLGLAIAREIAERHGGSISIESSVTVGTEVTVKLPMTEGR